mgnify:CR=1 FL=1
MARQKGKLVIKGKKNKKSGPKKYIGVRYAMEDGEVYAKITKIFGGPQCEVICADGVTRRCIIRAKFRGRRKRDNHIEAGSWVLVGVRDWGNSTDSKQICDLLTVYSNSERDSLKKSGTADLTALLSSADGIHDSSDTPYQDTTIFMDQDDTNVELEDAVADELAEKEKLDANTTTPHTVDEDIFVDDI